MNGLRGVLGRWSLLAGLGASLAAQAVERRFELVLWTSDAAAQAARAAGLGYTAMVLGRGADPAPLRAAGLGYYLDQPVGKGVFELRDEQWRPLVMAYESARDPAVAVRPGCFATPGLVDELATAAAAEAKRVAGPGLRFVALADEPSATRHDAPLDTCRCTACQHAFRAFLMARFGALAAVNEALGTQFERIEDLVVPSVDQVRHRELGDPGLPRDLRAFRLHQQFVTQQYGAALERVVGAVRGAVPGVPVGLTGLSAPGAFGGNAAAVVLPLLTLAEPYEIGGAPDLAASFLPAGAERWTTVFPPDPDSPAAALPLVRLLRARFAAAAAHGLAGAVVWNDANVFAADGAVQPFGGAIAEATKGLRVALDACAGAAIEAPACWLVESQASVQAWWMLDSARDGMTWVRRLASYEATHSTSQAARRSWCHLLRDLGLQPRFVAAEQLVDRLVQERPRCLVLPATLALDDRSVQAIGAYVRAGGTLLADHSAALYDADLKLRAAGALDDLFGIRGRSLRWEDLLVREGTAGAAAARSLGVAERGLLGRLGERSAGGDTFLENRLGRGRAVYLNAAVCDYARVRLDPAAVDVARELRRRVRSVLQQAGIDPTCDVRGAGLPTCIERVPLRLRDGRAVLAIRLDLLDAPELLGRLGREGPRDVTVELPAARRLRHLGGEELGVGTRFELRLDPWSALFLEDVGR